MALRDVKLSTNQEYHFQPGERKWWKRQYHKKMRKLPVDVIPHYGKYGGGEWMTAPIK